MIEKRDVVRRLRLGLSIREISRETGMHRTVVRQLRDLADRQGWLVGETLLPSEEAIAGLLWASSQAGRPAHTLDCWRDRIKGWLSDELSFVVIHRRLVEEGVEISEPTVRRYIQANLQSNELKVSVPRIHGPGKVMEVDFGYLGFTWDPVEYRRRKTWVFSGRLRASRRAWREAVFNQKSETFLACHIHAFEHFAGVPESVVPDNLKAAVISASFEDPLVNKSYQLLAEHYGFVINPCLPYHPRHKGGVESDVKYITGNFWKDFKVRQREKGNETPDARDLQQELERWSREVADERQIRGAGATVHELFLQERPSLKPLPAGRWEPVSWHRARVQDTWRIQYRKAYYTVPYRYVGKEVDVLERAKQVIIFFDGLEIARHEKARRLWETKEAAAHQPPQAEAFLASTRERIQALAQTVGPSAAVVTTSLLARSVVDGLRPARALLALRKVHTSDRLEEACRFALIYDCREYRVIKAILEQGSFEKQAPAAPVQETFAFARQAGYFAPAAGGSR
jgi:transposase